MTWPCIDLSSYRRDFPMLSKTMHGKPLIYLDSAATAHKPRAVIDAVSRFYSDQYATVLRAVYQLSLHADELYQQVREKVARFIGAESAQEIIYTRSATAAINLVAYSFGKAFIQPGDRVLLSAMEHHSNLVPWQIMSEDRGAQLQVIPIDQRGEIDLKAYGTLLEECKPKLVAVTHVSNVLGTVNPIREMARQAHEAGAKILVDGAQSVPHLAVDMEELGVDFYAFSGHKLYGPTGIGLLYGKRELLEKMPPMEGGGAMVEQVTFAKTRYNVLPWKFEAGTMMLAEVAGLGAAIDYMEAIGLAAIQEWEGRLLAYAEQQMKEIDGMIFYGHPSKRESVISFNIDRVHPLDLATFLDLQGVAIRSGHHCAQPLLALLGVTATARLSIGLYNDMSDIDQFICAIRHCLPKLR